MQQGSRARGRRYAAGRRARRSRRRRSLRHRGRAAAHPRRPPQPGAIACRLTMPLLALLVAILLVASQAIYTVEPDASTRSSSSWARSSTSTRTRACTSRCRWCRTCATSTGATSCSRMRTSTASSRRRRRRSRSTSSCCGGSSTSSSTTSRCRATRTWRAQPAVADGAQQSRRGVQQGHDARGDFHRPRPHHDRDAAEGRPGRTTHRRRGGRRAPAPPRAAERRDRPRVRAHGIGAPARGQRAALDSAPPSRRRSAPTPIASAR